MDLTFRIPEGVFNLRAAAVILHEGRILAMKDERSPYYYLPGGRVGLGETAEDALLRELKEEIGIRARIVRPLWLNQGFFNADVEKVDYHEVCLYFLVDVTGTAIMQQGETFLHQEGRRSHFFQWLPMHRLRDIYFYPLFLKEFLPALPESLTLLSTAENDIPAPGQELSFGTDKGHFSLKVCGVFLQDDEILTTPAVPLHLHEDFATALKEAFRMPYIGMPLFLDQHFTTTDDDIMQHELCLYVRLLAPVEKLVPPAQSWLRPALTSSTQTLELLTHRD